MDVFKAIADLQEEKKRIDMVIEHLEALLRGGGTVSNYQGLTRSRRGRKNMGEEERAEVSARMKNYWAKRRKNDA